MSTRLSTRDSGTALKFVDGATNNVNLGNAAILNPSTEITISVVVKPLYPFPAGNTYFIAKANAFFIRRFPGTPTAFQCLFYNQVGASQAGTQFNLNPFIYNHIVMTVSGGFLNTYKNGVLLESKAVTYTGLNQNSNNIYVGDFSGTGAFVSSTLINEPRIWSRALSDAEVSGIYFNNIAPRNGLVGEWLFDEGVGSTALDTSGNANHGTITGATYTTDVPFKPRVATTNRTAVQPMNTSLNFSAASDKVDCGVTDFIGTGDISVSGWIKITGLGGSSQGRIIDNGRFVISTRANNIIRVTSDAGGNSANSGNNAFTFNGWIFLLITRTSAGVVNIFVNRTRSGGTDLVSGATGAATTNSFIGNSNSGAGNLNGKLKDIKVFNRILTTTEQDALMSGINPTDYSTSIVRDFSLNEGAGTTVYSRNNSALTGDITGATWSSDTPTKIRNQVGGNLVRNGDLSYIPQVNVAQTGTPRWVDGTVGGNSSTTNNNFNWAGILDSTACSVLFDTTTLTPTNKTCFKIEATNATGRGRFIAGSGLGSTAASISRANLNLNPIFVLPSTSYTISYYMKTLTCQANTGITYHLHNGVGTRTSLTNADVTSGTTDWTLKTTTFTTGATDRYIVISAGINNAGSTQTCWIGDITLTPTVNTTRVAV